MIKTENENQILSSLVFPKNLSHPEPSTPFVILERSFYSATLFRNFLILSDTESKLFKFSKGKLEQICQIMSTKANLQDKILIDPSSITNLTSTDNNFLILTTYSAGAYLFHFDLLRKYKISETHCCEANNLALSQYKEHLLLKIDDDRICYINIVLLTQKLSRRVMETISDGLEICTSENRIIGDFRKTFEKNGGIGVIQTVKPLFEDQFLVGSRSSILLMRKAELLKIFYENSRDVFFSFIKRIISMDVLWYDYNYVMVVNNWSLRLGDKVDVYRFEEPGDEFEKVIKESFKPTMKG